MSAASAITMRYDAAVRSLSGPVPEGLVLLFVRVALGGIFWRSGQSKVAEGTWFQLTDSTYELFRTEYAGVPLPAELAAVLANTAEHVLPALHRLISHRQLRVSAGSCYDACSISFVQWRGLQIRSDPL